MAEKYSEKIDSFIQKNSPDGGFLQSKEWLNFQKSAGNNIYNVNGEDFWANVVNYSLPIVGNYFYIPRGPIIRTKSEKIKTKRGISDLINLAKKNKAGWIRIDIRNESDLELITELIHELSLKIKKAPHDMQPKQIFKIDISGSEEDILSGMKPKTRYNIRLATKKGVEIKKGKKYINEFLRLVNLTSERQGITSHPENYYRKMLEIPNVELYIARIKGKSIVANVVSFYGDTVTYLHGASDNEYRNLMAPFLLQWQTILDAKREGFNYYDFGGVKTQNAKRKMQNDWEGITRFKMGFSKNTNPIDFLGSYDIVISPFWYNLYRILQNIKSTFKR